MAVVVRFGPANFNTGLTVFSNTEFATPAVGSAATSCEFAEAVRFQYVSQPRRGTTVTLARTVP